MVSKVFEVKGVHYLARLNAESTRVAILLPPVIRCEKKMDASLVPEENTPLKQFDGSDLDKAIAMFREWKLGSGQVRQ